MIKSKLKRLEALEGICRATVHVCAPASYSCSQISLPVGLFCGLLLGNGNHTQVHKWDGFTSIFAL